MPLLREDKKLYRIQAILYLNLSIMTIWLSFYLMRLKNVGIDVYLLFKKCRNWCILKVPGFVYIPNISL